MLLRQSPFSYPLIHNIGGTLKLACIGTFHREWLEVLYADEPEARKTSITWARILVLYAVHISCFDKRGCVPRKGMIRIAPAL